MSESSELLVVACPHCHTLNRLPQQKLDQAPACGRCHQPVFQKQPFALDDRFLGALVRALSGHGPGLQAGRCPA